MDATAFLVPNQRKSAARKPIRRFGRFTSSWRAVPSPLADLSEGISHMLFRRFSSNVPATQVDIFNALPRP